MFENTRPVPACPAGQYSYCHNCDLFADLDGLHVVAVERPSTTDLLQVVVESAPARIGCPDCGVIAHSAGRKRLELIDPELVHFEWLGDSVPVHRLVSGVLGLDLTH